MSNSLNQNILGKVVIVSAEYTCGSENQRKFRCEDGFGCFSFTSGQAIFGTVVATGEKCRIEGYMIEKLAEVQDEEIK
jgi:hypothetical protein